MVGLVLGCLLPPATLTCVFYVQAQRAPGGDGEYVALGSSFAAAPGVGARADGSPTVCLRSDDNYPRRVAESLDLSLTDVTCSGATIDHVLEGGQYFLPAQVDALRAETRLVTVTIGGNDLAFLGNLTGWACGSGEVDTPFLWKALGACDVSSDATVDDALERLPDALREVVATVRERSPRAEVILLDYPAVVPESGSCQERLPLTEVQMDRARAVQAALNRTVAEVEQVGLVSAYEVTSGHDICSSEPWVTPYGFPGTFLNFGAVPFHPTEAGVEATARVVERHARSLL